MVFVIQDLDREESDQKNSQNHNHRPHQDHGAVFDSGFLVVGWVHGAEPFNALTWFGWSIAESTRGDQRPRWNSQKL